jgi:hypothetical protein
MTRPAVLRLALAATLVLALPQLAAACPVCFGNPNSSIAKGASNGVLFMIGVVVFVQAGFVALFWSFRRRMKRLATVAGSELRVTTAPLRAAPAVPPQPAPRNL